MSTSRTDSGRELGSTDVFVDGEVSTVESVHGTLAARGHPLLMPLFPFGHGIADRARLLELLRAAEIRELVDARTAPGSRRNPDVAHDEMARWLPEHGIEYR